RLGPAVDAAGEVGGAPVAPLLQKLDRLRAAAAGAAVNDEIRLLPKLGIPLLQLAERNLDGLGQIRDRPFVRLADVQEGRPIAAVELLLQLFDGNGGDREHASKLSVFSDQFSVFWLEERDAYRCPALSS